MRYQYSSRGYSNQFDRPTLTIPPGVKFLLILNAAVFILVELSGQRGFFFHTFGLVPNLIWEEMKAWQLLTYLFIHGGFFHLFFNMFVLWMFGKDLETQWGKNEFLFYYFTCGMGSGLFTALFSLNSIIPVVGASGAIYGLLLAYGFTYPNRLVYLYGLFPLKVKYMVIGLGVIAFFASMSAGSSGVSHITHLSGMIIGFVVMYYNFNWKGIKLWYFQKRLQNLKKKQKSKDKEEIAMKKRVDQILDKLNDSGWESLTEQEEQFLTKASKKIFGDRPPN